ncbi:MAG: hypothetical protein JXQ30_14260 [Spirochaetes bacterium]|nr:hypothetical protein [Spirochaetota bacterium]
MKRNLNRIRGLGLLTTRTRPWKFKIRGVPFLLTVILAVFAVTSVPALLCAGPYPPPAREEGTTAVYMADPAIFFWASDYENYLPGDAVDGEWQTPEKALGMATGRVSDVCSLGRGGEITLLFDAKVPNRDGWDFAVFENGLSDTFLELACVEVSSDGSTFARFDCVSLTEGAVGAFGALDTTNVSGLAGKYRIGYGTPFDLQSLSDDPLVIDETVDIDSITHIRIVDVIGDGNMLDMYGHQIYDPYPTTGSAGFDLDAVGVLTSDPTIPWVFTDGTGSTAESGCFIATAAFGSPFERHVTTLVRFRDEYLLPNGPGRAFVGLYYRYSPPFAAIIAKRPVLRAFVRAGLLPLACVSRFLLDVPSQQKKGGGNRRHPCAVRNADCSRALVNLH